VAVSQNKKDIKNAFETSHVTQDFAVVARYPIKMTRKKILNEEGKYESILRAMFLLSSFLDHLSCTQSNWKKCHVGSYVFVNYVQEEEQ